MDKIDEIERNKDKFDLAPSVEFVARHLPIYQRALDNLRNRPINEPARKLAESVNFFNLESIIEPQVSVEEIRRIISVMPESMARLSKLKEVKYFEKVPVPVFDEEGNWNKQVDLVECDKFPRQGDHPSRILVGYSTGEVILPTPIPRSVSQNDEAIKIYQNHVFLHEFGHTVDYLRRKDGERSKVLLECDGKRFTLQDVWNEFERLSLLPNKKFVSGYAATYEKNLNEIKRAENRADFDTAIGEQVCESFVGYMLGIISNNNSSVDFQKDHPLEYGLIDKICRAKVLED